MEPNRNSSSCPVSPLLLLSRGCWPHLGIGFGSLPLARPEATIQSSFLGGWAENGAKRPFVVNAARAPVNRRASQAQEGVSGGAPDSPRSP